MSGRDKAGGTPRSGACEEGCVVVASVSARCLGQVGWTVVNKVVAFVKKQDTAWLWKPHGVLSPGHVAPPWERRASDTACSPRENQASRGAGREMSSPLTGTRFAASHNTKCF